jgi:hypothetical protein
VKRGGRLTRRKVLKRSPMPARKKPLNRVSKKRRKLMAQTSPARKSFVAGVFTCQCCMKRKAVDCHEIARGASRGKALEHRCAWLALCRTCHDLVDDLSEWPVARQLALKLLGDGDHFDLVKVNELRGRDECAITMPDVAVWLRMA